jgi:hypothetical protein
MMPELLELIAAARHAANAMRNMRQGRFIGATWRLDRAVSEMEKRCQADISNPAIAEDARTKHPESRVSEKPV